MRIRRWRNLVLNSALEFKLKRLKTQPKFVVVAMPNALHLAGGSASYLEPAELLIVANGMSNREASALCGFASAVVRTPSVLPHHFVLESLIKCFDDSFWIVDHDCFVVNSSIFESHPMTDGVIGHAFFQEKYGSFEIPQTFLMHLNPQRLRANMSLLDIGVGACGWEDLSGGAVRALQQAGISKGTFPEPGKRYFDTFRALHFALSSTKQGFEFVYQWPASFHANKFALHIGATSFPKWWFEQGVANDSSRFWSMRYVCIGAFGWKLLQEAWNACAAVQVADETQLPSADEMQTLLLEANMISLEEVDALRGVGDSLVAMMKC